MSASPIGLSSSRDKVADISNSVDDLARSRPNSEECDSAEDDVLD